MTWTLFKLDGSARPVAVHPHAPNQSPPEMDGWVRVDGDFSDGTWKWDSASSAPVQKTPEEMAPPPPPVDPTPIQDRAWTAIRARRDKLLAETDWIILRATDKGEEAPLAWKQYRQALRDITAVADPFSVVWPTPPSS